MEVLPESSYTREQWLETSKGFRHFLVRLAIDMGDTMPAEIRDAIADNHLQDILEPIREIAELNGAVEQDIVL